MCDKSLCKRQEWPHHYDVSHRPWSWSCQSVISFPKSYEYVLIIPGCNSYTRESSQCGACKRDVNKRLKGLSQNTCLKSDHFEIRIMVLCHQYTSSQVCFGLTNVGNLLQPQLWKMIIFIWKQLEFGIWFGPTHCRTGFTFNPAAARQERRNCWEGSTEVSAHDHLLTPSPSQMEENFEGEDFFFFFFF